MISLTGVDQTLKALRQLEPKTAKEVGQEVSKIGVGLAAAVRSSAPSQPPVSGWRATSGSLGGFGGRGWPGWTQAQATSLRRGMSVRVRTTSPDGNIIATMAEFMGSGNKIKDPVRGARLSRMANQRMGGIVNSGKKRGRLVYKAIAEEYPQIMEDLQRAADKASDAVNRLMP